VHAPCQRGFLLVERLGSTDVLPACPTRFARRSTPFAAELKLKLSKAGEHARHHAPRCSRAVDALPQRAQHDVTVAQLADSRHDFGGVAAQAVNADHHDCVARPSVVKQRGQAGSLLAGRRARQFVAVDPVRIDPGCAEGVELLVERLMAGADTGVSELSACGWGSGCGHDMSMSQKSQNHQYCDEPFEGSLPHN